MGKFKKVAAVLAIMLFLLPAGVSYAQPQDVAGHWAEELILEWLDKGWAKCCEDGSFNPDAEITRGEFIALTNRVFEFTDSATVNFSDLAEDHRYGEDIARAVAAGYISGFADGTVRPDKPISRIEAAVILAKIAGLPSSEDPTILDRFTDKDGIPAWGRGLAGAVVATGLLQSYEDGSFRPEEHLTRAEAIALLNNAPDVMAEYTTKNGYLGIVQSVAESGSVKKLVIYYVLGEDFTEGIVTFHLPPGITAAASRDMVVISDTSGRYETIILEPLHIAKGGQEVHVAGITAPEEGGVMLLLAEQKIPEPGYHNISVIADADGAAGPKAPSADEVFETAELFSRMPPGYEGILQVSPVSARSGSKENLTLTYTLGDDFKRGWIEFNLPAEIVATPGQDKVMLGGIEKLLTAAEISNEGEKVLLTGITGKKGDTVALALVNKLIPEPGPYFFKVRADADGEGAAKPATLGAGREFMAFFAYSEIDGNIDTIKSFIKALNEGDAQGAMDLLAEDVVHVDNYLDGYFELYDSEEVAEEIDYMVEAKYEMVDYENTFKALGENVWVVEGKANDYFTGLTAALYPGAGFAGMGYTAKYFVTDNKICYMEFLWNRDDEDLYYKLTGGFIGAFFLAGEGEDGEIVIEACVPGLPGDKAGLKPGDIIVAVDGIRVEEMEDYRASEVYFRLLGPVGTKVKLTINRNGEVFDVEIVRAAR
ncbi:MAG: BslA/BslB family hydrophobin [bacterium]|jgi:hypothetical protein